MINRLDAAVHCMSLISSALPTLTNAEELEAAVYRLLEEVFECDEIFKIRVVLNGPGTELLFGPNLRPDPGAGLAFARIASYHPSIQSYLLPDDNGWPRRVSDLVSETEWESSPAYKDFFHSRGGRFQLSLVTELHPDTGQGWVLTREHSDFNDLDVEIATMLLPLLKAMSVIATLRRRHATLVIADSETRSCPLTQREQDVLHLLGQGLTAAAIAHRLGMSEGTARKHLNHIYGKLGVHDRLSAVMAVSGGA